MPKQVDILSIVAALLLHGITCTSFAQHRVIAPIERTGYSMLTSYDSLRAFLDQIKTKRQFSVEQIAVTRSGRIVSAVSVSSSKRFGLSRSKARVLLFAQQHGDEPSGKEALLYLLAQLASGEMNGLLRTTDLLIIPQMNPDGSELRTRRTADSIDLNRNHLLLTSSETRGLHDLFHKWTPHVTADIHEYSSFSKEWSDGGFIKTGDVQLGMLTNPKTSPHIRRYQHERVFPFIAEQMSTAGFSFHEYIVGNPSTRIRHSTTDVDDGRQSFGILGTLSFIFEGRKWKSLEGSLGRRTISQYNAIRSLLEFCAAHAQEIVTLVNRERANLKKSQGKTAILRAEHVAGHHKLLIPIHDLRSGSDTIWSVSPYHSLVESRAEVNIPRAYIVPREYASVLECLRRHRVLMHRVAAERSLTIETYIVDSLTTHELEEVKTPVPHLRRTSANVILRPDDYLIPTEQLHSMWLSIVLEPESMWGINAYPVFQGILRQGAFPIGRVPW